MKYIKRLIAVIIVVFIAFLLFDCSMQKKAENHSGFTKNNLWAYYFYTDADIRNAPKITNSYHFLFRAQDGGKPEISAVVFSDATDISVLRQYLQQLGYQQVSSEGSEERWEQPGKVTPAFFITNDKTQSEITLSKEGFNGD
ncbi:hypothetical protein [Kosakonia oryziphila]|uniref:Uncharacterized protein n=1 Tax=Kosakonia oryziphila TaxID=1005667 RepID=A0A1C4C1V2_9ENTR|nr:hypothetical protein [Kosakonia oryziphila]SCC12984.1 hypothetical protein GA0061070_1009115 [Kosakonia oryziphila]